MVTIRWKTALTSAAIGLIAGAVAATFFRRPPPPAPRPAPVVVPPAPEIETRCADGCRESFDRLTLPDASAWVPDVPDDRLPFSDNGVWFHERHPGFAPPAGDRLAVPVGSPPFLTIESYSRHHPPPQALAAVVPDPADASNRVLRIASPEHTDGTILRTTRALGTRYEVCARVGFIDFGTGDGLNGYQGGERNEPWTQGDGRAVNENGCYFSALYRGVPRPSNNTLAHHLRLAFIDSDNNTEGWTSIFDARTGRWFKSGWHPVMLGVAAGGETSTEENGPPFISYAAGEWNRPGQLYAADGYKENAWYAVCMRRDGETFTMRIAGDFRYGGRTAYEAAITDAGRLFRDEEPAYWLLGDPHTNYYEGSLLVDDVTLRTEP